MSKSLYNRLSHPTKCNCEIHQQIRQTKADMRGAQVVLNNRIKTSDRDGQIRAGRRLERGERRLTELLIQLEKKLFDAKDM